MIVTGIGRETITTSLARSQTHTHARAAACSRPERLGGEGEDAHEGDKDNRGASVVGQGAVGEVAHVVVCAIRVGDVEAGRHG